MGSAYADGLHRRLTVASALDQVSGYFSPPSWKIGFISGVAGSRILGAWRLGDLEFLDYGLGLNQ